MRRIALLLIGLLFILSSVIVFGAVSVNYATLTYTGEPVTEQWIEPDNRVVAVSELPAEQQTVVKQLIHGDTVRMKRYEIRVLRTQIGALTTNEGAWYLSHPDPFASIEELDRRPYLRHDGQYYIVNYDRASHDEVGGGLISAFAGLLLFLGGAALWRGTRSISYDEERA